MPQEILISAKQTFVLGKYEDGPLQPGQIRGRTLCTLISQGTELGWANGDAFPIRPGYAAAFEVTEIASGVDGVSVGDRRFAMGPHRSTQTHDVRYTLALPNWLSPDRAVLARLMGVSMTSLMTTKARAGDRVVVSGAGPVGFLAAHLFRIGGYRVTVVDPDPVRRAQMVRSGIADCRGSVGDVPDLVGKVSLVLDCSGHEGAILDACRLVQKRGEVVMVGVPWKRATEIFAHELMQAVFFNLVTLRSGWEWEVPLHGRDFVWEELLEGYNNAPHSVFGGFSRALDWLCEGLIDSDGLVRHATPDDPASLYGDISRRKIEEPFIVIDWR
jgi:threonine dehydrogenase-like Zn-dependent dehydrogenase